MIVVIHVKGRIMSARYRMTYFNGCGRAETIRMIFAAAGVPFEDVRVPMEDWAAMKPSVPMYGLPLLEFDGLTMCQSLAIARYLSKQFGLAGNTDLDQFRVDMIVDSIEDAILPIRMFGNSTTRSFHANFFRVIYINQSNATNEQAAELRKAYIEELLPVYLGKLETMLKANNNGDGYFVGDSLTCADLHFLCFEGRLDLYVGLTNALDHHPKLKALTKRVRSLPRIAEWMAKRPVTPF